MDSENQNENAITSHYASGYEADRLYRQSGKLETVRTQALMQRYLPAPPAIVRDVGGGTGVHAAWLAKAGYEVHLIDIVPLHVELATKISDAQPNYPIADIAIGDGRSLSWQDNSSDAVLLFGPLYHLPHYTDRMRVLSEARRVLKPGGVLMAVGISRFASILLGLFHQRLSDPNYAEKSKKNMDDGKRKVPIEDSDLIMETYSHHPFELRDEVNTAGFSIVETINVEGVSWLLPDFDELWENENRREQILMVAELLETEPSLMGLSSHIMVISQK